VVTITERDGLPIDVGTALIFETPDGRRIAPGMQDHTPLGLDPGQLQHSVFAGAVPDPPTAKAKDGGRFDMDHAIMVIAESCRRLQTEAGHSP
jgi:hypothetical protein